MGSSNCAYLKIGNRSRVSRTSAAHVSHPSGTVSITCSLVSEQFG